MSRGHAGGRQSLPSTGSPLVFLWHSACAVNRESHVAIRAIVYPRFGMESRHGGSQVSIALE